MEKRPEERSPRRHTQVITPASAQRADTKDPVPLEGYALHDGAARSMEDVTVRNGSAPLLARGEGAEELDLEEELLDPRLASGGAPD